MPRNSRFPLGAALAVVLATTATALAALEGKITEVETQQKGPPSVIVNQGSSVGIRVGQTVEVRRDGKAIGYGSVVKVFMDLSVATVGTVVSGTGSLRAGDAVVFHDSGFNRGTDPAPTKVDPPPSQPRPREGTTTSKGKVVNVRDGVVLVDFGRSEGLSVGHVVSLRDGAGNEVGRIDVELVGQHSAGGLLVSGSAKNGLEAVSMGRLPGSDGGIDFVALDFLGMVANLEHPTPHRSACHVGVPVRRVLPGSPAERGGLTRGDRVISIDGIVVRDIAGVRDRIQARSSERVRLVLIRGDRIVTLDVDFRRKR